MILLAMLMNKIRFRKLGEDVVTCTSGCSGTYFILPDFYGGRGYNYWKCCSSRLKRYGEWMMIVCYSVVWQRGLTAGDCICSLSAVPFRLFCNIENKAFLYGEASPSGRWQIR